MRTPVSFGLGFRTQHFAALCDRPAGVDWLEVLTDTYLTAGGPRRAQLERLRRDWPIALHGVGLGIANDLPPRTDYVERLRRLAQQVEPLFVSDHLCWTGLGGRNSHDLLPVALTREVLEVVADRVARIQDTLGHRLLLENASAYVAFRGRELSEAELLAELCERTGCGVLLDVNNLVVNAHNLGLDPTEAIDRLAARHVGYLHVAGHSVLPDVRIDTHGDDVPDAVWELFRRVAARFPHAPVILERDDAIPPLALLTRELDTARAHWLEAARGEEAEASARRPAGAVTGVPERAWAICQREFWSRLVDKPLRFEHRDTEELLEPTLPVSPPRGLRVYSDAHASTMRSALASNFPALARVLSPRDFAALAAAYVAAHPSTSHDYVALGARLPGFLRRFALEDAYAVSAGALADLAALEQARLEVQEESDALEAELTLEELAALCPDDWESARFELAPAHRVIFTEFALLPALRASAAGERIDPPLRAGSALLVSRRNGFITTEEIDPQSAEALCLFAPGAGFLQVCAALGGASAAPRVARALALASARGLVGRSRPSLGARTREQPLHA